LSFEVTSLASDGSHPPRRIKDCFAMAAEAETSLWPVVVGGLLAIGGGVVTLVGSFIRDWMQLQQEQRKERLKKFEDMVAAVYEFDDWLERRRQIDAFGKELPEEVSPFYKLQAISAAYFPRFLTRIEELDRKAAGYRVWMTGAGKKRIVNDIANMDQGFDEAIGSYCDARNTLLEDMKGFAQREFHSIAERRNRGRGDPVGHNEKPQPERVWPRLSLGHLRLSIQAECSAGVNCVTCAERRASAVELSAS
jgi:hypothetical protein